MTGALCAIDIAGRDGAGWPTGRRARAPISGCGRRASRTCSPSPAPAARRCSATCRSSIEQHVEWIADCLAYLRRRGVAASRRRRRRRRPGRRTSPTSPARRSSRRPTVWYMGANIAGKTRVFLPYIGGVGHYRERCDRVAAADTRGSASRIGRTGKCDDAGSGEGGIACPSWPRADAADRADAHPGARLEASAPQATRGRHGDVTDRRMRSAEAASRSGSSCRARSRAA